MIKRPSSSAAIRGRVLVRLALLTFACFACDNAAHEPATGDAPAPKAGVGGDGMVAGSRGAAGSGTKAGAGGSGGAAGGGAKAGTGGDAFPEQGGGGAAGQAGTMSAARDITRGAATPQTSPNIDPAEYASLIQKLNQFGLELGRRQAEANELTEQNCVYSPLSASIALSMTYAGARGDTADELERVLGGDLDASVFHSGVNRLARELASRELTQTSGGDTRKIELEIADAIFADNTFGLQPGFLDLLSEHYDSGVHREDFRNDFDAARVRINDWVALQTRDKIKDLLPDGSIDAGTPLVLVNALYFYASWKDQFFKGSTADAEFHTLANATVAAATMHKQGTWLYSKGSDFVALDLPYVGESLSMFLVLPNEDKFEEIRKGASAEWLESALNAATAKNVSLSLPKFKMTVGTFKLSKSLEAMGLSTLFTDAADLSGISTDGPLHVRDVFQKAFISLDENGTEAAAATAVVVAGSSAPSNVIQLSFDRPFLFFIHDENGAVLLSGHVVDPSQN